jgi:heme-degrading monooxygenase HmoA
MSAAKKMTRYSRQPDGEGWKGPVLVRGWLRVSRPWAHPIEVLVLMRKWMRVRRALNGAPGFLYFEYWQRIEQLVFGMHVGWSNEQALMPFDDHETHRDIAGWAIRSKLVVAMKLETFAVLPGQRLARLGGFHMARPGDDLPSDELFVLES